MQLPAPFVSQMQSQLGDELADFLEALSSSVPTSIHLNPFKDFEWKENFAGVKWHNNGVYLPERPSFTLDPAFHAGAYYVQEASSMLIAAACRQLLDLQASLKVLDLCAAPGGKTTLLSGLISENSLLVANEVIRSRYQTLDYNLAKWGNPNKITTNQQVEAFKGLKAFFDLILVDAPCSGEGLFRKDPKAIEEWSPESVKRCSIRQQKILMDTVELLKPGGVLLYSTCTYNDRENSENARWLVNNFPLESIPLELPEDWGLTHRQLGVQCYPHRLQGEGFYLAAFRKLGNPPKSGKSKGPKTLPHFQRLGKGRESVLRSMLEPRQELIYLENAKGRIIAIPATLYPAALQLSPFFRYCRIGTPVGVLKGKILVPDPALALSKLLHSQVPRVEVDRDAALQFLRRETPKFTPRSLGWQVVSYQGLPLGWIKALKDRINNYYPKEWRIRMAIS